jgi:mRNA interferase RelE/StbE
VKVLIDESFEKDIKKVTDKKLLNQIADCIEEIIKTDKLSDISACKKLTGSKNAYRIRIGDYRIGFVLENQIIILIRFMHRSKIYRRFPDK